MITNNFGTLLYSFFLGKKIGEDNLGNKFYIHKYSKRKWVLYKKSVDPTQLSVEWHKWLTDSDNLYIPKNNIKDHEWQKRREPNYSGTQKAYHPKLSIKKEKFNNKNNNEIWTPK